MSYIRCLSNPEALYIWGEVKYAMFVMGGRPSKSMPIVLWERLLRRYAKLGYLPGEGIQVGQAKLREVRVGGHYQYRLSYGKIWHIDMWEVTWEYIAQRNLLECAEKRGYNRGRRKGKK